MKYKINYNIDPLSIVTIKLIACKTLLSFDNLSGTLFLGVVLNVNRCVIFAKASFAFNNANFIPIQFLGPAPTGDKYRV